MKHMYDEEQVKISKNNIFKMFLLTHRCLRHENRSMEVPYVNQVLPLDALPVVTSL